MILKDIWNITFLFYEARIITFQDAAINWSVLYIVFHKIVFCQKFSSVYMHGLYYVFQDNCQITFIFLYFFSGNRPPQDLGMISGQIRDPQLTASSNFADHFAANAARLYVRFGWRPATAAGSWLQVRSTRQQFKVVLYCYFTRFIWLTFSSHEITQTL